MCNKTLQKLHGTNPGLRISSDSFLYSCKPMKLILYQATIAITEIDFVLGPFRCQIELGHLDFAVERMGLVEASVFASMFWFICLH